MLEIQVVSNNRIKYSLLLRPYYSTFVNHIIANSYIFSKKSVSVQFYWIIIKKIEFEKLTSRDKTIALRL